MTFGEANIVSLGTTPGTPHAAILELNKAWDDTDGLGKSDLLFESLLESRWICLIFFRFSIKCTL